MCLGTESGSQQPWAALPATCCHFRNQPWAEGPQRRRLWSCLLKGGEEFNLQIKGKTAVQTEAGTHGVRRRLVLQPRSCGQSRFYLEGGSEPSRPQRTQIHEGWEPLSAATFYLAQSVAQLTVSTCELPAHAPPTLVKIVLNPSGQWAGSSPSSPGPLHMLFLLPATLFRAQDIVL